VDEPQAYLNGRFVPLSQATIAVSDAGFVLGASVTEQLRTFRGCLFHRDDHLRRLQHSLDIVGIQSPLTVQQMADVAERLVQTNFPLVDTADDLGLSIFVTLMLTDVQQTPSQCWPRDLKCRSRMHYFLADRAAAAADPGARAILKDATGHVLEATTANLIAYYRDEGFVTPPQEQVLPGISWSSLLQIADQLGLPFSERPMMPEDVAVADELLLSSTPYCLLPVTRWNGAAIGNGQPGPVFQRLIESWSELVGVDIIGQAKQFARRQDVGEF
jgi:branched-subunit amino acid aminotransferase/4-amino-4-deoxychorismate lyase